MKINKQNRNVIKITILLYITLISLISTIRIKKDGEKDKDKDEYGDKVVKELGRGKYGVVHMVLLNKENYARKLVQGNEYKTLITEIQVYNDLKTPCQGKVLEMVDSKIDHKNKFSLLYLKLAGKSLDKLLEDKIDDKTLYGYMTDIAESAKCMHENDYLHRDLHEGNIILNPETKKLMLFDFGRSITMEKGKRLMIESNCLLSLIKVLCNSFKDDKLKNEVLDFVKPRLTQIQHQSILNSKEKNLQYDNELLKFFKENKK